MIKVIERREPKKKVYRTRCDNCNSLIEFEKTDVNPVEGQPQMGYEITCPVCNTKSYLLELLEYNGGSGYGY
jgi:RNase P subunit RPR2